MSERVKSGPPQPRPDPAALGFSGSEETGWTSVTRGREVHFRLLRTLAELVHAERLQEEVFGVSERDLIPANELIVVAETGGAVIGAFLPDDEDRAVGVLVGWGGFLGRPRVVSDFLAIRPEARSLGLATALKRLQAAIALSRGFAEIVWTVDPLRAANARLNFGKLGATANQYEIDRYGATFAAGLYGGLPTDRLHVTWEIASPRVIARLLGQDDAPSPPSQHDPAPFAPGMREDAALVAIPADIDALLAVRPDEALTWRLRLRETLCQAFAAGFAITGFRPAAGAADPAYLLERGHAAND
jgi:predicted GNAT superfamily acetyltransferase